MKFTINSSSLYEHLQNLNKVTVTKPSVAILECVLMEINEREITLTASDGETRLTTHTEMIDLLEGHTLKVAIRARQLLESIKEVLDQVITVQINPETFLVEIDYLNGSFQFPGQDPSTYPSVVEMGDEPIEISIPQHVFLAGVAYTITATSNDDARPITTGIHLDVHSDHLYFVGTDGFLLSYYKNSLVHPGIETNFTFQKKPSTILRALLSKESDDTALNIKIYNRYALLTTDRFKMVCRLIEGKYPNFLAVVPTDNNKEMIADRLSLLSALRRVSMFASPAFSLVSLDINAERLLLKGNDVDFSTAAEEQLAVSFNDLPMLISFKSNHLMDVLANLTTDKVVLKLADKAKPGLLSPFDGEEGVEITSLIMPLMH